MTFAMKFLLLQVRLDLLHLEAKKKIFDFFVIYIKLFFINVDDVIHKNVGSCGTLALSSIDMQNRNLALLCSSVRKGLTTFVSLLNNVL